MRNVAALVVLVFFVIFGGVITETVGLQWLAEPWLVGLGVMILIAYVSGEAVRTAGLPAILGWIAVGILMGPHFAQLVPIDYPLELIDDEVVDRLDLVQVLIISLIGMLGGVKFRLSELSGKLRLPLLVSGAFLLTVIPLTMAAVLLAGQLFPEQLAFIAGQPASIQITIALVFGVLSFGLAPTVTVAVLQDVRSRGPLSTAVLGVVFVAEFILFVLFAVVLSFGQAVVGPDPIAAQAVLEAVPQVLWTLGLSVLLGVGIAAVMAGYFRFVGREPLFFVLTVLIAGYFGVAELDAQPLLTFLIVGFAVQNATSHGEVLNDALDRIALPVFVVYFAVVAAGIDLMDTLTYLPLVVMLVASRMVGLYWGTRWASASAVEDNHVYEFLRTSLFPQAAVVLVLAAVVAESFAWGPQVQSVVVATVVVYLIVGSVFLKLGLDRAGETRKARRALLGGADGASAVSAVDDVPEEQLDLNARVVSPKFEDVWLQGHVQDLREQLVGQAQQTFSEPVRRQFDELHEQLEQIEEVVDAQKQGLEELVEQIRQGAESDQLVQMGQQLQQQYAEQIAPVIEQIEQIGAVALDDEQSEQFFEYLRRIEQQDSLYRIDREESVDQLGDDDNIPMRGLKTVMRARNRLLGRGYRTVPVGKLWRYHVELALPLRFESVVPDLAGYYEKLWRRLWRQFGTIDEFWDELLTGITRSPQQVEQEAQRAERQGHDPHQVRAKRKRRFIEQFQKNFRTEQKQLRTTASRAAMLTQYHLGRAIGRCFQRFVDAVGVAGTIYLPRFRYRPAVRYNASRRAEMRLLDRLRRQEAVVSGYRGWIRLDHEVSSFQQWTLLFRNGLGESVHDATGREWKQQLGELGTLFRETAADQDRDSDEIQTLYHEQIRPDIAEFRRGQKQLITRLQRGEPTRKLVRQVDERIEHLPHQVRVWEGTSEEMPTRAPSGDYELPLRRWMRAEVARQVGLQVAELNQRAIERVRQRLEMLSGVEQVLEYNLSVVADQTEPADQRDPLEVARQGLQKADELIAGYLDASDAEHEELQQWLDSTIDEIVADAIEPIEQRKPEVIRRRLRRSEAVAAADDSESPVGTLLDPLALRLDGVKRRVRRRLEGWGESLRSAVTELEQIGDIEQVRQLLVGARQQLGEDVPPIYRRLFEALPLEIPELYRPRPQAEQHLIEVVEQYFSGQSPALLIDGDPGVGKRTFLRQVIPGKIYAVEESLTEKQLARVQLQHCPRDESEICARIAEAVLHRTGVTDFEQCAAKIQRRTARPVIVVVTGAEQVMLRTEDGLQTARRFFEMVEQTSEDILWIVSMQQAAADFLRTHIELDQYFSHRLHIEPMDPDQLQAMVMSRHHSGDFELRFAPPDLSLPQRLRYPLFGPDARRVAKTVYFERLANRCEGNPRAALLEWLRSVHIDPVVQSQIVVEPLELKRFELLEPLGLEEKLILANISLHHRLTIDQLRHVLADRIDDLELKLRRLKRLGLIDGGFEDDHWHLQPLASVWVNRELRGLNLI